MNGKIIMANFLSDKSAKTTLLGNKNLSSLKDKRCFVSWSGGKDSCLAMHRAMQAGARVEVLVNMMVENGERSRSHGLRSEAIQEQARALGLRREGTATSWKAYEEDFCAILTKLKNEGFDAVIFGDIDLQEHLDWEQMVCDRTGLILAQPLWLGKRMSLMQEFIKAGFETRIVAVRADLLEPEYLGKVLSIELAQQFEKQGIDACGENGEFHTVVTNGPCFQYPLEITSGDHVLKNGYWFLDLKLKSHNMKSI